MTPELRFPEFEGKWEEKKLGEVYKFRKGRGIPKSRLSNEGQKCILYGQLYTIYDEVIEEVESYTDTDKEKLLYSKKNDILIPSSGETALDMSMASALLLDNIALCGDINILRSKKDVNSSFMSYQLNGARKIDIAKISEGSSVVHLYNSNLQSLKVYTPTLPEQAKIGNFFYKIDKKLELQEERIEALKEYKKGMMQKIFNQEIRFKDDDGKDYPGWEEKRLGEVLKESNIRQNDGNYRILSSTTHGIYYQDEYFKNRIASQDTSNYKVLRKDQIVFSPQNIWMGNINFNRSYDIGIVSPSYKIYNIREEYDKEYIGHIIKLPKLTYEYMVSSEQGASTVRRNLNINLFEKIKVHLPSLPEQKKIANFLSSLDKKIELEEEKLEKFKEIKKGLMQKMFI